MKNFKLLIGSLLILATVFTACEKDDICDPTTATTPKMVVVFRNIDNPSTTKSTVNLSVFGKENDDALLVNNSHFINDTVVRLPLKTIDEITTYRLVMNSNDEQLKKSDTIQFAYAKTDSFLSKACGFKSTFDLFGHPTERPFVMNNSLEITGNWIKKIEVNQPEINTEDETHIIIYH